MDKIIIIIAFACLTTLWIHSEPTIRLRSLLREGFFKRLTECALCSSFWVYLIGNLYLTHQLDIFGAAISSVLAEFISRKISEGRL